MRVRAAGGARHTAGVCRGYGGVRPVHAWIVRNAWVQVRTAAPWRRPVSSALPFKPAWRSFWAAGPDQTYVVIACRPVALEAWSAMAVIAPEPFGRRSARLVRQDERWEFDPG